MAAELDNLRRTVFANKTVNTTITTSANITTSVNITTCVNITANAVETSTTLTAADIASEIAIIKENIAFLQRAQNELEVRLKEKESQPPAK